MCEFVRSPRGTDALALPIDPRFRMKNGTSEAREVGVDFDLVPSALKRGSIKGWGCARAILVFVNSIQGNVKREIRSLDRSSRSMSPYFLSLFLFSFFRFNERSRLRPSLLCKFNFPSQ